MNIMKKVILIAALAFSVAGCQRIQQGEAGIRVNFNKTVEMTELQPGSLNQTIWGDVITFKVRDVTADIQDVRALDSENASLKDYDLSVIYSINPSAVAEIYTTKSRSFHGVDDSGDVLLMSKYVDLIAKNAAVKAARKYKSLNMMDNRGAIEEEILKTLIETLKEEKLDQAITVSQVQIKNIVLADVITQSANALVNSQNELARKQVELQTAKVEAERIATLNANTGAIPYMQAQANMKIADAVAAGHVSAIIIPHDFKGIVTVPGKN